MKTILANARQRDDETIACACPLCQVDLDSRQLDIEKADPGWTDMPIVCLSQFVGRAVDVSDHELGLKKHLAPVEAVLA